MDPQRGGDGGLVALGGVSWFKALAEGGVRDRCQGVDVDWRRREEELGVV